MVLIFISERPIVNGVLYYNGDAVLHEIWLLEHSNDVASSDLSLTGCGDLCFVLWKNKWQNKFFWYATRCAQLPISQ